jgi:type II secretory ATPase GspE/PulE/Tfp pilus assembly ATPase PilB-like protein
MGFLTRRDLNTALSRKMGYPIVDVAQFPIEADALRMVPFSTAIRLGVMPLLRREKMLVIAAGDPTRRDMLEELEFMLETRVIATLGDEQQIQQILSETYEKYGLPNNPFSAPQQGQENVPEELTSSTELLQSMELTQDGQEEVEHQIEQSDNTLVRLINTMIIEAYNRGASDIHVETHPGRTKTRIRFRKDGVLSHYLELPHTYRAALTARLKIMADLDISERRKPQDGKIDFSRFSNRHKLELRIATIPTSGGLEDVVMRLLSSSKPINMERLGLSTSNLDHLREAVSRPYGMVLCVGPTGSGKTTTLHSVLGFLNTPQRKIWTAEDPIEITQPDLRQVQVNAKIDWTFAKALRSFLRADPDVIMVGEIRDKETAQIAIEASLTGHLVLSTLHTNSAAETVTRLIDMGMDPFNFADSLLAVLAQRLVRRMCPECRASQEASDTVIHELLDDYLHSFPEELRPQRESVREEWLAEYGHDGRLTHYSAPGCSHCQGTGVSGRVGMHELMVVTPSLRRLIQTSARPDQLQFEGMQHGSLRTLRQDGIRKVLSGLTTIEEVRANSNV